MTSSHKQRKFLYEFGPFRLDPAERLLLRGGRRVELTDKTFDLLVALVEHGNRLVETDTLRRMVWGVHLDDSTVPKYVSLLRTVLGDVKKKRRYVETVWKRGYRFKHPVREVRRVVVVLPFRPHEGGAEDERLGLALASAVISRLGAIGVMDFVVRPRSAVIRYDTPDQDPPAAAREQRADYVVAGLFRRSGQRIEVDVKFLRAQGKVEIWSRAFSGEINADLSVQEALADSVARDVASHFGEAAAIADRPRVAGDYTTSSEAYQLYVDGRFHWNRFTRAGFKEAIRCFRQAIRLDRKYAKAYAGLADCWTWMAIYSLLPPDKTFPRARKWALKALRIYPELAGAHVTLGFIEMFVKRDHVAAADCFERAVGHYRNNLKAHLGYSLLLTGLKKFDRAITEIDTALEIFSASLINKVTKAMVLHQAGRNPEALAQLEKALGFDENFDAIYHGQALVLAQQGAYARAAAAARKAIVKSQNNLLNHMVLAYVLAKKGEGAEARKIVRKLESLDAEKWYVSPFHLASVYAALGQRKPAYAWLEQARDKNDPWFVWLNTDPRFDSLRTDPDFEKRFQVFKLAEPCKDPPERLILCAQKDAADK